MLVAYDGVNAAVFSLTGLRARYSVGLALGEAKVPLRSSRPAYC